MNNGLSSYTFIFNGIKYDYPLEESVESILPAVDQHILCECFSTDGTGELCDKLAKKHSKIKLIHMPWGNHFSIQEALANYCVNATDFEWSFKLDADEILHHDSIDKLREIPKVMSIDVGAVSTHYTHFMANYETEFDFCYRRVTRMTRKGFGWYWSGDACDLNPGRGKVFNSDIEIFHYGKVKNEKIAFQKEWDFQQMYTDLGFPDPKMREMKDKLGEEICDYLYLFEDAITSGKVRKFTGTHPLVMQRRIQEFKSAGFEQFVSKMKEGLKL